MRQFSWFSLMMAGMVVLAGCHARPDLARPHAAETRATVWLTPTLMARQGLQAVVNEYQASDIHRIEIVPYWIDKEFRNHPLSKVTGEPTTADDPEILKVEMSGEALVLNRAIALSGLRREQRYRIAAYAYSLDGELLSSPLQSSLLLEVGGDDRPRFSGSLPIFLKPVAFNGILPLEIALSDPAGRLDHLEMTVYRVWGNTPFPDGSPVVIRRVDLPRVVTLLNLAAETAYHVELKARPSDPEAPDLVVETVRWTMENDDAPATRSVTVTVP